jgi:hypothetical protein
MRIVQRASAWIGWLVLLGVGVLLILEATGVMGDSWRQGIRAATDWLAHPSWAPWFAALVGALTAIAAVAILVAQVVPARMARRTVLVERGPSGSTAVSSLVVRRAAVQRLREVEGIVGVTPTAHGRRLVIRVQLAADANAVAVAERARAAVDESFWTMLGLPRQPIDLTLTYVSN